MAFQTGGTNSRGSGPHSRAPALGGLRLLPVHGVGAPTFAPLTRRRRKRKKVVRAPHPDSSLSPQPPRTATATGNAASSHLPGSTRKHTLHANQPSRAPPSPEAQVQPRAGGGGGAVLRDRTTHERRNLDPPGSLLPLSTGSLLLRLPSASPRPWTRAIPTTKMAATAAPPTA